ncbi:aldehyde dehydrogenase family protein [Actinokineospora iranica]|uniref:Acyl-CoA reductase n=1 Tax=Actinokineospora iranica TaxID=1271860 RepID=A0A1G6WQM8_9PSEU|nr:aldehyde dehydrogenase family protein [Actinokineospora iranica]SDD67355.1 Acyl-CoA reductase [Actinokineospora iranica]
MVEQVVQAARAAFGSWSRTAPAERAAAVREAAAELRARVDEVVDAHAETNRDREGATGSVLAGVSTLEQYAELGPLHRGRALQGGWDATDLMVPQPRGVVVALTPWNDPVAVACGLIGAALVTGNTVIHKPSERAPKTGDLLGSILSAHLPPDVLTTVTGDASVGANLVADPGVDVVAHVGSTRTGRAIAEAAARTGARTLLENGGNDPLIVDADVDPEWAAEQAALGAFANAGQVCTSVERIYAHRAVAEPFLAALVRQAGEWDKRMCPLVDRAHRDAVHAHVAEAVASGARLLAGGRIPDGEGSRYPATVLTDCGPDLRVVTEETFGPVAPVVVVSDFDHALALACSGGYGLAASVLSASMEHAQRAWRELPVGTVKVNAVFGGAPGGAAQPRGLSGHGFGYGPELLDELTATKVVHLSPAPAAASVRP